MAEEVKGVSEVVLLTDISDQSPMMDLRGTATRLVTARVSGAADNSATVPIIDDTTSSLSITGREEWLNSLKRVYTHCTRLYIGGSFQDDVAAFTAAWTHRAFPVVTTLVVDNLPATFVRREIKHSIFPQCRTLYLNAPVASSTVRIVDTYKWSNEWARNCVCVYYGDLAKASVSIMRHGMWAYNSSRENEEESKLWNEISPDQLKVIIQSISSPTVVPDGKLLLYPIVH